MSRFFTRTALVAAVAGLMGAPAIAQDSGSFSGTVTLTSDYVYRGFTQTDGAPMIQGSFDYANDSFYAGTWASGVDFGDGTSTEIDLYAGWTPSAGAFDFDIGAIYYWYPDAPDNPEQNFFEVYAGTSTTLGDTVEVGASVAYSPDFYLEVGDAFYYSGSVGVPLGEVFGIDATIGYSDFSDLNGADYTDWSVGLTTAFQGFDLDFRYIGTDVDGNDDSFVVSISRSL